MKICLVSLNGLPCYIAPPGDPGEDAPAVRGGSELQVAMLARSLAARGHEVTVVVTDLVGDALHAPRTTDLRLVNAYDSRAGLPGFRFLVPRWRGLRRALREVDAEVYFQRGAAAVTGQVAHTCGEMGRPFVFGAASDSDTHPARVRLGPRARWLYRYGLKRAAAVVAQHAEQQIALRGRYDVTSTVIGSIAPSFPETAGTPATPPVVLWLGNFRRVKRPELFLDLARRFPEARFEMIGGTVRSEPDSFRRFRTDAASLPNVVFHGPLADPNPMLARAWVLVNTSEVEGFPSSFVEAWSHGVPTLSFVDPGGVVTRGELGTVAADPEDLAQRLAALLASREDRDAQGHRGRAYVDREHRADAVASRYEQLFASAPREPAGP